MDLFEVGNSEKLEKGGNFFKLFASGKMNLQIISASDKNTSLESLLHIKYLFQKMLPKMPKDYILRQVFNEEHVILTLNELIKDEENLYRIIGAVCYRPCFERKLNEIVFFAIDSDFHVSGYGTFLFNCFKEICKSQYLKFLEKGDAYKNNNLIITDLSIFDKIELINYENLEIKYCLTPDENHKPDITKNDNFDLGKIQSNDDLSEGLFKFDKKGIEFTDDLQQKNIIVEQGDKDLFLDQNRCLYLLTYADNSAIGFFKKQGFTLYPRSNLWIGYIKDYEGGTLMECKLHFDINYLKKKDYVDCMRDKIFEAMKSVNDFHNLHYPDEKKNFIYIFHQFKQNQSFKIRTRSDFLKDFINFLICTLQAHPSAWPFLEPVSVKDVPDYFEVIKYPMDLSLIHKKSKMDAYKDLKKFSDDLYLMCRNCMTYNGPDTQYYKCAVVIKDAYDELINRYKITIERWGFKH